MVYELNNSPNNPSNNFALNNCLFGTANQRNARNAINSNCVYNSWGIGFNGADSCSFGNDFARNVVTFGGCFRWYSRKKICINFTKANTKFSFSLVYNSDESYLYVNKTDICKFKANELIPWYKFCLRSVSKDFTKDEMWNFVKWFSVDHSPIEKEDILNIHDYLIE